MTLDAYIRLDFDAASAATARAIHARYAARGTSFVIVHRGWPRCCSAATRSTAASSRGWEQVAWVGTTTARRALAIALTGMMRDGEITRAEALARMVMRENAIAAYHLGTS